MEREGKGEGMKRRGRRKGGGEMRRRVIVGGMVIGLLMGCNSGAIEELEKKNESILSISNLRQGFLDAFVSFGDLLKDAFGIKAETTKKEVGEELGKVGKAVETVKGKLEEIKGQGQFKLITNKADEVITNAISTLSKIVNGANKIKEATAGAGEEKIANATSGNNDNAAPPSEAGSVKNLVEGINLIYGAAKEAKIETKGDANKSVTNSQAVGNLFGNTGSVGDANALKAAHMALTAASGADILAAIEAAKSGLGASPGAITAAANAFAIAIANNGNGNAHANVRGKGPIIAAGLALRAMAKGGKLATVATNAEHKEINEVLTEAVSKTVNEIISTIRKTVDKCLKDVSDCVKDNSSSEVKSSK